MSQITTRMNLDAIFHPRSIAIIGASRTPGKVGYILTENITNSGFKGKIYPVNPGIDEISRIKVLSIYTRCSK